MSLTITVRKNHLVAATLPWFVRSTTVDTIEYARLVDLMANGRTTLSKVDILAGGQLLFEEIQKQFADGRTVKTPFGSFYLSASGSMSTEDDAFLPDSSVVNHDVRIHYRADPAFESFVRDNVKIARDEVLDYRSPSIHLVESSVTGETGKTRAGDILRIAGLRLKFDPANLEEGVFFLDGSGTSLRCEVYAHIMPKAVIVSVPAGLVPGTWTLVLRTFGGAKDLREDDFEGIVVD